jgi:hypothetical protein
MPPGMPRLRDRVTSPRLAVTLKFALVLSRSCSMYDPSDEAKYFHSVLKLARRWRRRRPCA